MSTESIPYSITDGRVRTNPVWCYKAIRATLHSQIACSISVENALAEWVNRLVEKKVPLNTRFVELHVKSQHQDVVPRSRPGIIGLLVDRSRDEKTGIANPILAKQNPQGWDIHPYFLPFNAGHIQDCLSNLMLASGLDLRNKVPESVSFSISQDLNEVSAGDSMHIAGLLAVLDAFNNHNLPLFECACAIVMPVEEKLLSVNSVEKKLDAFVREFKKGSLLVHHPKDNEIVERYRSKFENVWCVDSYQELSKQLNEAEVLSSLLKEYPITANAFRESKSRIQWLWSDGKKLEAIKYAERLKQAATVSTETGLRVHQSIDTELENLNRHVGRFASAINHSASAVKNIQDLGELASFQELLDSEVRLAAAKIDGHEIDSALETLRSYAAEVENNPLLVNAESQIMFYNTVGRLVGVKGEYIDKYWFEKSLELQPQVDPASIPRTKCYYAHALLRSNVLSQAETVIENLLDRTEDIGLFAFSVAKFLRADLARRKNEVWDDPEFEEFDKHFGGYPFGIYLQATARQPREPLDKIRRFQDSALEFEKDAFPGTERNIVQLFASFTRLAAAKLKEDSKQMNAILEEINLFLGDSSCLALKSYYRPFLGEQGQVRILELFESCPYF